MCGEYSLCVSFLDPIRVAVAFVWLHTIPDIVVFWRQDWATNAASYRSQEVNIRETTTQHSQGCLRLRGGFVGTELKVSLYYQSSRGPE